MATPDGRSSKYRPRFSGPEIPGTNEFRLSTILSKHVTQEYNDTVEALLNVNSKYQQDLRKEIRHSLTIEQKIQNKNIHVAKMAQKTKKEVHSRARKLNKAIDNSQPLNDQLVEIRDRAVKISSDFHRLLARVYERSGKLPDRERYPKLYMASIEAEPQGKSNVGSAFVAIDEPNLAEPELVNLSSGQNQAFSKANSAELNLGQALNLDQALNLNIADPALPNSAYMKPNPASPDSASASDSEMTPAEFEQLMDLNISKYRTTQERRQKTKSAFKGPLKLLYSSKALANSDMMKHNVLDDSGTALKSPFVTAKSLATVLPTPQTSLHKKLRINAVPTQYRKSPSPSLVCRGRESDGGSPAKAALAQTLFRNGQLDGISIDDNAIDDNAVDTMDDDIDIDHDHFSNIDAIVNDSDSSDIDHEDLLMRRDLVVQQQRQSTPDNEREKMINHYNKTEKHVPAHRTLQPKGSILHMNGKRAPPIKPDKPQESVSYDDIAAAQYRASPRASFVSGVAATGNIVQGSSKNIETPSATVGQLKRLLT